ncbi:hypothetical protein ACOII7_000014 [Escherichia coli]|nr:hypothetical protein [Escherichia coli]ELD1107029.1 hypothetical protein [Escherichia coli]ELO1219629.1 hypothetical protein [Escherichia coli]ELO1223875.1 hypothetical protein [Escherichia coli]ELO1246218.1 hypothetical protein [Escherichia coli]
MTFDEKELDNAINKIIVTSLFSCLSDTQQKQFYDMNPRPGGDVYLTPMNMTTKPSDGSKAGKQKDNANADETTS